MASPSIHPVGKPVNDGMIGEYETYQFKVMCTRIKPDNWMHFPAFCTGEHFWRISCWPSNGVVGGEIGQLSFDLVYGGEWKDVKVTFDFELFTKDEASSPIKPKTTTAHTFLKCGDLFHFEKFVGGDDLKKCLKHDCFIVTCKIIILSATRMGPLDSGVTILTALTGTSKSYMLENKVIVPDESMPSGSYQFRVAPSNIMENEGKYVSFPMFMVGMHYWNIQCNYQKGHLSFYISVRSETKDLKVCLESSLLKKDEGRATSAARRMSIHTFQKCGDEINIGELKGSELKRYLYDEYFKLTCNLTILSETVTSDHDVTISRFTIKPKCNTDTTDQTPPYLHDHLKELWKNKERADVTFEVNEETVHAHRLILAARSPVFSAELSGPVKGNSTNNIKINVMEPRIFKAMLHFIYTDLVPDISESSEEINQKATTEMTQQLFVAADRYALERLKLICEDKLSQNITIDTVATTLALAEKHSCPNLKARCLEFVTVPQNFMKVAITDGYRDLLVNCPAILKEMGDMLTNMSI